MNLYELVLIISFFILSENNDLLFLTFRGYEYLIFGD